LTCAAVLQVLLTRPPLSRLDIAALACYPAFSEELLFRGALLGNLGDSLPVLALVSLLFGALHYGGGRNASSAVFATAAGAAFGGVLLATRSVWAAIICHGVGNITSAALWMSGQPQSWVLGLSVDSGDEPLEPSG
jgi:uncharacterized protein